MAHTFSPQPNGILTGRKLEWFHAPSLPEWGYTAEQTDTFALLYPADYDAGKRYPLYVVFHSAGHDIYTAVACCWQPGNHDPYHTPKDMFGLYLDCRQHGNDWWWGGNTATQVLGEGRDTTEKQPVEHRCMATVQWVMDNYPVDRNRVYAAGVSMGGSGAMGIAMCRGDIFAAVCADVPAGVCHMAARCSLLSPAPEGFRLPDPPVLIDWSAQNDYWSAGHRSLYQGMHDRKFALLGFFGTFGHESNNDKIRAVNDLIFAFDPFSVRLDEAYPVFTDADCDDPLPWGEDGTILHENPGQVNGFFRWGAAEETENSVSIPLRLLRDGEYESRFAFPKEASADVSLRRLQKCRFTPGAAAAWTFGGQSGTVTADGDGLVTVNGLRITQEETTLTLTEI